MMLDDRVSGHVGVCGLIAALFVFAVALLTVADASEQPKPKTAFNLSEVREGLRTAERRVANLSVTCESEVVHHFRDQSGNPPRKGLIQDDAQDLTNKTVSTWIVDSSGRMWQKHLAKTVAVTVDNHRIESERDVHGVFDGKRGRMIEVVTGADGTYSNVSALTSPRTFDTPSPLDVTLQFLGTPVSRVLSQQGATIEASETWEGKPVIVVASCTTKSSKGMPEYKTHFWVDSSRDFAIVRRQTFVRYANRRPWHLQFDATSHDLKEVSPGVWLPARVEKPLASQSLRSRILCSTVDDEGPRPSKSSLCHCPFTAGPAS